MTPDEGRHTAAGGAPPVGLASVRCRGDEFRLDDCQTSSLPPQSSSGAAATCGLAPGVQASVAGVACVRHQADLVPDLDQLVASVYLEDKQLFYLQCAMEENCLASRAYEWRQNDVDFATLTRRLMRFTTAIENVGTADFRPFIPKRLWEWHACHQHYHSMEVFAHFDILDARSGERVAEGHKASFCLEDNECANGVEVKYDCENYGDQGISPGCKDIYYNNIDCQWIDVTEVPVGSYLFHMAINPEYKVAEQTFENNAATCNLLITQQYAALSNCSLSRPARPD